METQAPSILELIGKPEPLDKELKKYLNYVDGLGPCIRHPLVYSMMHFDALNAMVNNSLKVKKECIKKAMADKNYQQVISMHEKPYRVDAFIQIARHLDEKEYWKILANVWIDVENIYQYDEFWPIIFSKKGSHKMMNKEEKALLKSFPKQIAIYRGHQRNNVDGWSWTVDYHKARWFSTRLCNDAPMVSRKVINKSDVIALLLRRGELEIITRPDSGFGRQLFSPGEEAPLKLVNLVKKFSHGSFHGLDHWKRVFDFGMALGEITPGCDRDVVGAFALLHDSQRLNEDNDKDHGNRAAKFAIDNNDVLGLSKSQLDKLEIACRLHDDGQVSNDPTIGVCWDADRLDLPRVGKIPDHKYLSTEAAKRLMWTI